MFFMTSVLLSASASSVISITSLPVLKSYFSMISQKHSEKFSYESVIRVILQNARGFS